MCAVLNMNPTLCGPDQIVLTGNIIYGHDKWTYCTRKDLGLKNKMFRGGV